MAPAPAPADTTHILVLGATGRVGRHVVAELVRRLGSSSDASSSVVIHAATRDPASAEAQRLLQLAPASPSIVRVELVALDLGAALDDPAALEAAFQGKRLLFLAMPQAFTPQQMLRCQEQLAAALGKTTTTQASSGPRCLVKLSSYGIDDRSATCVVTQGPLGEAHRAGEVALLSAAPDVRLVSLRPSSFFANFDAYDAPGLRRGERVLRSPLGAEARVNWVGCEDIGAAGAALLAQALAAEATRDGGGGSLEVVDVLGAPDNTVSGPELAALASRALAAAGDSTNTVRYEAVPVPDDEAYGGLWRFLRAGGFDASIPADASLWRELVGRAPRRLEDHVKEALSSQGL